MKKWLYVAGTVITALCIWFFAGRVVKHWHALQELSLQPSILAKLPIAIAFYLAIYLFSSAGWRVALKVCGQRIHIYDCIRINMVSQFAKFMPGNVGHHIGRVFMASQLGASPKMVVASIFLDMLVLACTGAFLSLFAIDAAIALARQYDSDSISNSVAVSICAAILAIAAFVALAPRYFPAILHRLRNAANYFLRKSPTYVIHATATAIAFHTISFALGTASILSIVYAVTGSLDTGMAKVLGAFSLAWLAGFLLPGAPAGIGVRELVIVLTLGPVIGGQSATIVTALFRVVTTVGDGIAFLIGLALPKRDTLLPGGRRDA